MIGVTQQHRGIVPAPSAVTGTSWEMVCGDRNIWGVGGRIGGGWDGLPSGYEPPAKEAGTVDFTGIQAQANGIAKHMDALSWGAGVLNGGGRGVELRRGVGYYDALRQTENFAIAPLVGAVANRAGEWLCRFGVPENKKNGRPRRHHLTHD